MPRYVYFAWPGVMHEVRGVAAATVAFVDVNVVPMDRERVLANQTVLVEGGTITVLGPANQARYQRAPCGSTAAALLELVRALTQPGARPERLIDTDQLARVAQPVFYLGQDFAGPAAIPRWSPTGRENRAILFE